MTQPIAIFWFRRDMRLDDNVGLFHALNSGLPVLPIFIFDEDILDKLPRNDARVTFIHDTLQDIRTQLESNWDRSLAIYKGVPAEVFERLLESYHVNTVYTNRDYEPYAEERDTEIEQLLKSHNCKFQTFKDQVIFEKDEVVKKDGNPYVVYTPYMRSWKAKFQDSDIVFSDSKALLSNCIENKDLPNLSLSDIGFERSEQAIDKYTLTPQLI